MRKGLILGFVFVSSIGMVEAQTSKDSTRNNSSVASTESHYLGINAGTTTGVGLSYAYWPRRNGFQLTFLPLIDKSNTYISLAGTYLHTLKVVSNNYTFFLYWGNHYTNMFGDHKWVYHTGFGPGVKFEKNGFSLHFMVGYGIYNLPDDAMTRPTIELGGFYKF